MSSSYNPKLSYVNKIPPFNEYNFKMWKSKPMFILETLDFDMLNIVDNGPDVPMYQPSVNNAHVGPMKQKTKTRYDDGDKRLISLDVKAQEDIGNSILYHMYHLVQNCECAQEMMEMLNVAYEDTVVSKPITIIGMYLTR